MKTIIRRTSLIVGLMLSLTTQADVFEFIITSPIASDMARAKNCMDYSFLPDLKNGTFKKDALYQSNLTIELPSLEHYRFAFARCAMQSKDAKLVVLNKTQGLPMVVPAEPTNTRDIVDMLPNVFLRKLSKEETIKLFSTLQEQIKQKQFQAALSLVIQTFNLDTMGYSIAPNPEVDRYHATTVHNTKKISIGSSFLEHPCDVIQVVRHELEHAFQMTRVNDCKAKKKPHALDDHLAREQSAYLNDLYSFKLYCPTHKRVRELEDNAVFQLFNRYSS